MQIDSLLKEASVNAQGEWKPTVRMACDTYSYHIYQLEGLEGYHKGVSDIWTEKYDKPHAVYLNYGYFQVKPVLHMMKYRYTNSGPEVAAKKEGAKIKKMNGARTKSAIFEVKDATSGAEGVLWVYTTPGNILLWQKLRGAIETIIDSAERVGIACDANGYLPLVIRVGKLAKGGRSEYYAAVVGFTEDTDMGADVALALTSQSSWEIYSDTPAVESPYESQGVPRFAMEDD